MTLEEMQAQYVAAVKQRHEAHANFYRLDGVVQFLSAMIAQEAPKPEAPVPPSE